MTDRPTPTVGMGATLCLWSDRHAYTIVSVSASGKTFQMQRDRATRVDDNGMSDCQTYEYTPDPTAPLVTVRLTKRGWSANKTPVAVGTRREFYDFSF